MHIRHLKRPFSNPTEISRRHSQSVSVRRQVRSRHGYAGKDRVKKCWLLKRDHTHFVPFNVGCVHIVSSGQKLRIGNHKPLYRTAFNEVIHITYIYWGGLLGLILEEKKGELNAKKIYKNRLCNHVVNAIVTGCTQDLYIKIFTEYTYIDIGQQIDRGFKTRYTIGSFMISIK